MQPALPCPAPPCPYLLVMQGGGPRDHPLQILCPAQGRVQGPQLNAHQLVHDAVCQLQREWVGVAGWGGGGQARWAM